MTKKEFERLKEGDKVRIVHKRTDGMNQMGDMDHWLGKVMTVAGRWDSGGIKMEEDRSERDDMGWYWGAEMIECKVSESIAYIEILTRENKTIAKSGKKVGTARRSSKDEADKAKGVIIAVARLCGYDVVTDEKGKVTLADKKKTVKASGEKEYELLSWDKAKKAVSGTKFYVDDLICGISESMWDRLLCPGKIASLSDEEQKRPYLRKMIAVCTGELRWAVPKCCVIEKKQGEKTKKEETAKDRVKKELAELEEKIEKLSHALAPLADKFGTETEAYSLLNLQLGTMRTYANILLRRLAIWKD